MIQAYNPNDRASPDLEDIANLAQEILDEDATPPVFHEIDSGFYASFWTYPKGDALA